MKLEKIDLISILDAISTSFFPLLFFEKFRNKQKKNLKKKKKISLKEYFVRFHCDILSKNCEHSETSSLYTLASH